MSDLLCRYIVKHRKEWDLLSEVDDTLEGTHERAYSAALHSHSHLRLLSVLSELGPHVDIHYFSWRIPFPFNFLKPRDAVVMRFALRPVTLFSLTCVFLLGTASRFTRREKSGKVYHIMSSVEYPNKPPLPVRTHSLESIAVTQPLLCLVPSPVICV